jgi:hypothetical protein
MEERSFMASMPPKICSAVWPGSFVRISAHSRKRGPRTGWARRALASSTELIAYSLDVGLCPSPAICGKTYHIQ